MAQNKVNYISIFIWVGFKLTSGPRFIFILKVKPQKSEPESRNGLLVLQISSKGGFNFKVVFGFLFQNPKPKIPNPQIKHSFYSCLCLFFFIHHHSSCFKVYTLSNPPSLINSIAHFFFKYVNFHLFPTFFCFQFFTGIRFLFMLFCVLLLLFFRVVSVLGSVESMMPLHSAIASARLKSNIAIDSSCWSWLSQGTSISCNFFLS